MGDVFVSKSVLRRMVLTTATAEQCMSQPASRRSSEGRELKGKLLATDYYYTSVLIY